MTARLDRSLSTGTFTGDVRNSMTPSKNTQHSVYIRSTGGSAVSRHERKDKAVGTSRHEYVSGE